MAGKHGTGFRYDKGDLHDFIRVDPEYITQRFLEAIEECAEGATQVMEARVNTADTPTGLADNRRGRVKTGEMLRSLRTESGAPYTIIMRETAAGRASVSFGFQSNTPDHTIFQEAGTKRIEAMLAHQEGMNYFLETVVGAMAEAADDVGDSLTAGLFRRRVGRLTR